MKKILSYLTNSSACNNGAGIALIRIFIGILMLIHGWDKLSHFADYSGGFMDPFGLGSTFTFSLVVFAEFFCSLLIILGAFTRLAAIPLIINMTVAIVLAHAGQPFQAKELAIIYLGLFIILFITGSGKYSIDQWIHRWANGSAPAKQPE